MDAKNKKEQGGKPCNIIIQYDGDLDVKEEEILETLKALLAEEKIGEMTAVDQIKNSCPYPGHGVLWKFAKLAYKDSISDDQLTTALKDWKIIRQAKNLSSTNGYVGWLFFNPKTRHVIVAHRGTNPKSMGALWTDLYGVVFKNFAPQVSSAMTFAEMVKSAVVKVNTEMKTNVLVSVTGHSLGGWLAQLTTFSMEYLSSMEKQHFRLPDRNSQNDGSEENVHPHTVVFDSPGCMDMLHKMADALDFRYEPTVEADTLDITTFLAEPNLINTLGLHHAGSVLGIIMEGQQWTDKPRITIAQSHSIANFGYIFDEKTLNIKEDKKLMVRRVVDWPKKGKTKALMSLVPLISQQEESRYQTSLNDSNHCSIFQFTSTEREFIEKYRVLRDISVPGIFRPDDLFQDIGLVKEIILQTLSSYQIEKKHLVDGKHEELVARVKTLLRFFPKLKQSIADHLKKKEIQRAVLYSETLIAKMKINTKDFENGTCILNGIIPGKPHTVTFQENMWTGLSRLFKEAQTSEFKLQLFDLSVLMTLERKFTISDVLAKEDVTDDTESMLVIVADTMKEVLEVKKELCEKLYHWKIIFVIKYDIGEDQSHCERIDAPTWEDLSKDYQEKMLSSRTVSFQGVDMKLKNALSDYIIRDSKMIVDIIDGRTFQMGDPFHVCDTYYKREKPLMWDEEGRHRDTVLMTKRPHLNTIVISAAPGMGKTSLLAHMASEMKKQSPDKWIVHCNLIKYSSDLRRYSSDEHELCDLMTTLAGCVTDPEKDLLKHQILVTGKVVILLDGFDEISPDYKDTVIDVIKAMKKRVHRIVVTTRPHMERELAKKIKGTTCTVAGLSESEQIQIMQMYSKGDADDMLLKLHQMIPTTDLTHNILVLVMFAEIMGENTRENNVAVTHMDQLSLYEQFVKKKFNKDFEKMNMNFSQLNTKQMAEIQEKVLRGNLMQFSLLAIFNYYSIEDLLSAEQLEELKKDMEKVKDGGTSAGFVTSIVYDTPMFVHRTFAEYFAAEWLYKNWESPKTKEKINDLFKFPWSYESLIHFLDLIAARDSPRLRDAINKGRISIIDDEILKEKDRWGRNILHLNCFFPESETTVPKYAVETKDKLLGWTPLKYACVRREFGVADYLLKNGADRSDIDVNHIQTHFSYEAIGEYLSRAILEIMPEWSEWRLAQLMPLKLAVTCKWDEKIDYFLSGIHPASGLRKIFSAFDNHLDCEILGDIVDEVQQLIIIGDVSLCEESNMTAVQAVAKLNHRSLMERVFDSTALNDDEKQSVDEDGNTLFTLSILKQKWETVYGLMECGGIDLFSTNKRGRLALDYAWDYFVLLNRYLVFPMEDYDDPNDEESSQNDKISIGPPPFPINLRMKMSSAVIDLPGVSYPLHLAAKLNRVDLLRKYSDEGSSLDERDTSGRTPFQVAADSCSFDCLKLILEMRSEREPDNPFWKKALQSFDGIMFIRTYNFYDMLRLRLLEVNSPCVFCDIVSRFCEMIYMAQFHNEVGSTSLAQALDKANVSDVIRVLCCDGDSNVSAKDHNGIIAELDLFTCICYWFNKSLDFPTFKLHSSLADKRLNSMVIFFLLLHYSKHNSISHLKVMRTFEKDCKHDKGKTYGYDKAWKVNWNSVLEIDFEWEKLLERRENEYVDGNGVREDSNIVVCDAKTQMIQFTLDSMNNFVRMPAIHAMIVLDNENLLRETLQRLENPRDLDSETDCDLTALMLASEGKNLNTVKILVQEFGADLSANVRYDRIAFDCAEDEDIRQYLRVTMEDRIQASLESKCDLDKALKLAIVCNDLELVIRCTEEITLVEDRARLIKSAVWENMSFITRFAVEQSEETDCGSIIDSFEILRYTNKKERLEKLWTLWEMLLRKFKLSQIQHRSPEQEEELCDIQTKWEQLVENSNVDDVTSEPPSSPSLSPSSSSYSLHLDEFLALGNS